MEKTSKKKLDNMTKKELISEIKYLYSIFFSKHESQLLNENTDLLLDVRVRSKEEVYSLRRFIRSTYFEEELEMVNREFVKELPKILGWIK